MTAAPTKGLAPNEREFFSNLRRRFLEQSSPAARRTACLARLEELRFRLGEIDRGLNGTLNDINTYRLDDPHADLQRHISHVLTEEQRRDRTLLDLQAATMAGGITPDPTLSKLVEVERDRARELRHKLEHHAARLRSAS